MSSKWLSSDTNKSLKIVLFRLLIKLIIIDGNPSFCSCQSSTISSPADRFSGCFGIMYGVGIAASTLEPILKTLPSQD
jgi:hypothetical protein